MKFNLLLFSLLLFSYSSIIAQNRNLSGGIIFDGEPFLAVNPENPQHMVVAWMGFVIQNRIMIKTRCSVDGGSSWSQAQNTAHVSTTYTSADPSLAFDNDGNIFLCYIDYDPYFTSGAVYMRKSTDGGLNWGNPTEVIGFNADPGKLPIDRPWISIDRSGTDSEGNIYVTSVNATGASGPPFHPYFIRSVNNGETFEPWRFADTTGWLAGNLVAKPMPTPAVTSDGTFHCIYPSFVLSQNILPQFILASSTDGGAGFNHHTVFASGSSVAVSDTSAKKGYLLRANPANPNHLAFFYLSNENGDADVYIRESVNAGLAWSDGIRLNDDQVGNGKMQDLVWAGFDIDGDLAVTWRDRRNSADTGYAAAYEIFCTTRLKTSPDFSANFRISDDFIPFDDVLLGNGNDFMSTELYDDTISAVWGDSRNGRLNIWFQRVTLDGMLVSAQNLASDIIPEVAIIPVNPGNIFKILAENIERISVSDLSGKKLLQTEPLKGTNEFLLDLSGFPSAFYIISIEAGFGRINKKIFSE